MEPPKEIENQLDGASMCRSLIKSLAFNTKKLAKLKSKVDFMNWKAIEEQLSEEISN